MDTEWVIGLHSQTTHWKGLIKTFNQSEVKIASELIILVVILVLSNELYCKLLLNINTVQDEHYKEYIAM